MPIADPATRTTLILRHWELGSTAAEHLCADILRLEGFEGIDPQLPVGGPDGGKDILCEKLGVQFVGAAYFPTTDVTFIKVRKKFRDDLAGAASHRRTGFIFMTNQKLTPDQRIELEQIAAGAGKSCLLYHRERLRVVLDAPAGYGVRLRHLRVPLAQEEQFAYFAAAGNSVASALELHTRALQVLARRIDRLSHHQSTVARATLAAVRASAQGEDEGADVARMLQEAADLATADPATHISAGLSADLVRYVHRLLLRPVSPLIAGRYRQTQVFLADPTGSTAGSIECPPWDRVPELVEALAGDWRSGHAARVVDPEAAIADMASFFHRLLQIHPFTDGNGRLAMELISLQARELLGHEGEVFLARSPDYYAALRMADADDLEPLRDLVSQAVTTL